MAKLSGLLVTRETYISNMYREFLGFSKYARAFWDDFRDKEDVLPTSMVYTYNGFTFEAGDILESINVIDPAIDYEVSECFVSIDYQDTGTPFIYVTADGGTTWEEAANNTVHTFTTTGNDLRIRFVGGNTGNINSWTLLYQPLGPSYIEEMQSDLGDFLIANDTTFTYKDFPVYHEGNPQPVEGGGGGDRVVQFYYEGIIQIETIQGFFFDSDVSITGVTLIARVAPTGQDLTLDLVKNGTPLTLPVKLTDSTLAEKTTLEPVPFLATDNVGYAITQVGSGEAGQGLTILLHYI